MGSFLYARRSCLDGNLDGNFPAGVYEISDWIRLKTVRVKLFFTCRHVKRFDSVRYSLESYSNDLCFALARILKTRRIADYNAGYKCGITYSWFSTAIFLSENPSIIMGF
jgi:hypothetical protein